MPLFRGGTKGHLAIVRHLERQLEYISYGTVPHVAPLYIFTTRSTQSKSCFGKIVINIATNN